MVRTSVLANLRFDETMQYGEDVLLWIRLARTMDIAGIGLPLSNVRIHGTNAILDRDRQLSVGRLVVRRAREDDPALPVSLLLQAYSSLYVHYSYLSYRGGDYSTGLLYAMLSFVIHPVQVVNYIRRMFGG
jgi:hypothetical protein